MFDCRAVQRRWPYRDSQTQRELMKTTTGTEVRIAEYLKCSATDTVSLLEDADVARMTLFDSHAPERTRVSTMSSQHVRTHECNENGRPTGYQSHIGGLKHEIEYVPRCVSASGSLHARE